MFQWKVSKTSLIQTDCFEFTNTRAAAVNYAHTIKLSITFDNCLQIFVCFIEVILMTLIFLIL